MDLHTVYWSRYEAENYFITPELLRNFAIQSYQDLPLFGQFQRETDEVLDELITERVFGGRARDFETWRSLDKAAARLLWEARTERVKLSDFAEAFFRRLAARLGHAMLLRKGEFYRLVDFVEPQELPEEVTEKLDLLAVLFAGAAPDEEV